MASSTARPPDIKRRHHYVWQHYLREWQVDGRLWCRLRPGKRVNSATVNVAVERDFYQLQEVSPRDIEVVKVLILAPMPPPVRKEAEGWIVHFTLPFRLKRMRAAFRLPADEFDLRLDAWIHGVEEEFHAYLERGAIPFLAALRGGSDHPFGDLGESADYTLYVAAQYLRTPRIANAVAESLATVPGFDAHASMGLMRAMLSTSLGFGFYSRLNRMQVTYLAAEEGAEFITGDQPILNALASPERDATPPDEVEIYYPVSPRVAVLLDFRGPGGSTVRKRATQEEVRRYNTMIAGWSHGQLYAASEQPLIELESGS